MMPLPTHLKDCIVPDETTIDETNLAGRIRCDCESLKFQFLYPGQTNTWNGEIGPCTAEIGGKFFFLIRARCADCGKEHLLIDSDFHGWDGFVGHRPEQASLPRPPLVVWNCVSCGGRDHYGRIEIETEGKELCLEEAHGAIAEDRWQDAFGWFTISIECANCGKKSPEWMSLETM
ncbi:MAG TPA: hypothetical protein VFE47_19075 [Tepidisphaeraceae bacterium]|jgi:hypothetical protein|nr:hypothetical protein [Tepidisphaeraceae bacterium]